MELYEDASIPGELVNLAAITVLERPLVVRSLYVRAEEGQEGVTADGMTYAREFHIVAEQGGRVSGFRYDPDAACQWDWDVELEEDHWVPVDGSGEEQRWERPVPLVWALRGEPVWDYGFPARGIGKGDPDWDQWAQKQEWLPRR